MSETVLKYKHHILLVDDEPAILKALQRVFRKEGMQISYASSGMQGMELLKTAETRVSLIVSDQRMPEMTGAEFLEKSREICPDAIRFLLTGYSEIKSIVDAVNRGGIHRYLSKPWDEDDLLMQVRQGLGQYELVMENRRLLALTARQNRQLRELNQNLEAKVAERSQEIIEKNARLEELNKDLEASFLNTVRSFASLMQMQAPVLAGHGRRVGQFSRTIAKAMGLAPKETANVEVAALLHDMGWFGFAASLFAEGTSKWSAEDWARYKKHPEEGQAMVRLIGALDQVGLFIRSHHEQVDGKGFPDGVSGESIPLGGRIIAVADAYDRIVNLESRSSRAVGALRESDEAVAGLKDDLVMEMAAVHHLKTNAGTMYDPEVVRVFLAALQNENTALSAEKALAIVQLKPGMILSRSLYSPKGQFLLPYDTVLTWNFISRLKSIADRGGLGPIYVLEGKQAGNR